MMQRHDWTWGGMGVSRNGGWVPYDDARRDIAEAERRGAQAATLEAMWWLREHGYPGAAGAFKMALDAGLLFDEPRQPESAPAPPQPTTVLEMVEAGLRAGGHDGLSNDTCGCKLGDLSPGDCLAQGCVASYNDRKTAMDQGTDFWMVPANVKP